MVLEPTNLKVLLHHREMGPKTIHRMIFVASPVLSPFLPRVTAEGDLGTLVLITDERILEGGCTRTMDGGVGDRRRACIQEGIAE